MRKLFWILAIFSICSSTYADSLKEILETRAIERDVTGGRNVIPVGFSQDKKAFAFIRKVKDCKCTLKDKKSVCEIYSYADVSPQCVPGIDEIFLQNLLTDNIKSLKKSKGPAAPITLEEATQLLKDEKIVISSLELKKIPLKVKNESYTASVQVIQKNTEDQIHHVLLSSRRGEKKLGQFETFGGPDSALKSEVIGFIETPDPERIIVVTSVLSRYFEEETNERVQFWGASLVSGFAKPQRK